MTIDEKMLKEQLVTITEEVITAGNLQKGDLFVLGCTTSEVVGGVIGKNSSAEVGQWIVSTLIEQLDKKAYLWLSKDANILIVLLAMERRVAEEKALKLSR